LDGAGYDAYLRRFAADGTPLDSQDIRVTGTETGTKPLAGIGVDGSGNIVVSWRADRADGSWDLYLRRYGPDGLPLTDPIRVTPASEPTHPWPPGRWR
jgi:hypothetical protein